MTWRDHTKSMLNSLAGLFGARLVGAGWGPRGVWAALERARSRGFSPGTIFDIGASNGQWTQSCRAIFPQATYLLADPLEENRAPLERLAASEPRISLWHGLIGAETGELELHCHGDQSSLYASGEFAGPAALVPVRPLDALADPAVYPGPYLIKADVQGHELEVLKGAEACLARCEALILEVSFRRIYEDGPLAHEILGFLGARGFCMYDLLSYIQRPADNDLAQSDIMFVRQDSPLLGRVGWS